MRSSNPVFSSLTKTKSAVNHGFPQAGYNPYGQYVDPRTPQMSRERAMTVDDIISKTGITVGVIIAFAVANFALALVSPGLTMLLTMVGMIGGFITVLISSFSKSYGSPIVTIAYAIFEGLFVGGISLVLSGWMVGGTDAGVLIGQAVVATLGVFVGMLWVYKAGVIRVTPKFTRFLMGALIGVVVLSLANLVGAMFFGFNPLRGDGPMAIIFSLVCIVLAALSFLQDFDAADRLVRSGAPAKMAWGVALGLAVTLVWLYTEILRLLSILRNN
ncbi:Bax inhibitor-1/YccA family protein [Corynebacterium epidermidicanis]|uniref:Putative membrane protein n=1 Tax=Corynebacterium epidermidicanis TaxID=1050174 RepID=A0A0G3GT90_9CORY|nr:Bax inhibitor-1/YccA family protein [Corynebacterium epidermidicanis]AKK02743.1 putative membrane protein [Corynebacterium epidermidicanis]